MLHQGCPALFRLRTLTRRVQDSDLGVQVPRAQKTASLSCKAQATTPFEVLSPGSEGHCLGVGGSGENIFLLSVPFETLVLFP